MKYFAVLILILMAACSPENKNVEEQVLTDTTQVVKEVDSAKRKTEIDGTLVEKPEKDDRTIIPENLKLVLDSLHPGWKLPTLSQTISQKALQKPQGPYFVAGYFNADKLEDFVIQIQEKRTVKVLAYLNAGGGFKEYKVAETKSLPTRSTGQSLFALAPAPAGKNSETVNAGAFSLQLPDSATTYYFRNNTFVPEIAP